LPTVAFPGSGLDRAVLHPHSNRRLADEIVRAGGEELAKVIASRQKEFNIPLKNIVVLASAKTLGITKEGLKPSAFDFLRSTESEERALLAGIEPENIKELDYIRLLEMLTIAMKLAAGETVTSKDHPNIAIENVARRIIRLIPKAEPKDYNELKRTYDSQATSLRAA